MSPDNTYQYDFFVSLMCSEIPNLVNYTFVNIYLIGCNITHKYYNNRCAKAQYPNEGFLFVAGKILFVL